MAAIGGVEGAGNEHHEPAAETGRQRGIELLRAGRDSRRHAPRHEVHRPQMARAKGQGVQQLQSGRRGEPRRDAHQAPADDAGRPALTVTPDQFLTKDSDMIACELECRRDGVEGLFVELDIPVLDSQG